VVIHGVVFDLDDTLFFERDYVRSGFACVARTIGTDDADVARLSSWLWSAFEDGVRGDTFDRLLLAFPHVAARYSVDDLIDVYRRHEPQIHLIEGTADVLDHLRGRGVRLGVLTDGPLESQSAKVVALRLERWFDPVVLTEALGPAARKPGTTGFAAIAAAWSMDSSSLVYVADNPAKDFAGPRSLGWLTIRFRDPRQERFPQEPATPAFAPDREIKRLDRLLSALA
jgi:putative hydrolase of the HAD superfamily